MQARYGPDEIGWVVDLCDGTCRLANHPVILDANWGDIAQLYHVQDDPYPNIEPASILSGDGDQHEAPFRPVTGSTQIEAISKLLLFVKSYTDIASGIQSGQGPSLDSSMVFLDCQAPAYPGSRPAPPGEFIGLLRDIATDRRSSKNLDLLNGTEYGWKQIAAWLDSDEMALRLMWLGDQLGVWELKLPHTRKIIPPGVDPADALTLSEEFDLVPDLTPAQKEGALIKAAQQGLITIQAMVK